SQEGSRSWGHPKDGVSRAPTRTITAVLPPVKVVTSSGRALPSRWLLVVAGVTLILVLLGLGPPAHNAFHSAALASGAPAPTTPEGPPPPERSLDVAALRQSLDAVRPAGDGSVSITFADPADGTIISLDGDRPMVGASTTKLAVALAAARYLANAD